MPSPYLIFSAFICVILGIYRLYFKRSQFKKYDDLDKIMIYVMTVIGSIILLWTFVGFIIIQATS